MYIHNGLAHLENRNSSSLGWNRIRNIILDPRNVMDPSGSTPLGTGEKQIWNCVANATPVNTSIKKYFKNSSE
jgi:hypothetical protein